MGIKNYLKNIIDPFFKMRDVFPSNCDAVLDNQLMLPRPIIC